jgi:hypothetical protein
MPKRKNVSESAIGEASEVLGDLPQAPKRTRKTHKRPNSKSSVANTHGLPWAEDTNPGVPRVPFPAFRVDPEMLEWFEAESERTGRARSVLAREAFSEYVEKNS